MRVLSHHLRSEHPQPEPCAALQADRDVAREVTLSADELAFYAENGFLAVPGVVREDACAILHDEVLQVCEKDPGIGLTAAELAAGGEREGDMLRQSAMYTDEQLISRLRSSPALLSLASQVVGGPALLYNGFTAVKGANGGGLFDYHQDNMYTRHDNGLRSLPRTDEGNNDGLGSCGIWVALHDLPDPENGCLVVAVGSHKRGTLPAHEYESNRRRGEDGQTFEGNDKQLPPDDPVRNGLMLPVRMRRGDIVLFTRATVHSSAPNTSPTTRVGYGLQYFREDVRWLDPRGAQDPGSSWDPAGEWRPLSDDSCPAKQVTPVKQLGETNPGLAAGSVNVSAPKKAKE